jgi:uncharacterized protein DUF4272
MSQLRIQDARAIAYRALCLGTLLQRAKFELSVQNNDDWSVFERMREHILNKHQVLNARLLEWLKEEEIERHLSEAERHLLQKPLGSWSERALISVGWRTEALGTMLWVLNRYEHFPSYDKQFETRDVLAPLDIFNSTIDFIWMASLQDDHVLRASRDQAELWNWRSRARELERMGVKPPEGVTFREIIRLTAERAYESGHTPELIDGDFPSLNKAYAELTDDEYALMSAIAYERYSALNWVCEITNEWESTRIDGKK